MGACGGGQAVAPEPATPAPPASGDAAKTPSDAKAQGPQAPAGSPMRTPTPSAMAEDLKALGIDPLHPPPLRKLSPDVVRKLMPTFTKALGVKCSACHDINNFRASTPNRKVAAQMWQHFVVELAFTDGAPLYCDSCHGGKLEFLDTYDGKALGALMDANYVAKLQRVDQKTNACATCHGEPFDPKPLKSWAAGK
jgi:hypothetical protein